MRDYRAGLRAAAYSSTALLLLALQPDNFAWAQPVADDDDVEDIEIEEMVVTGSRIRRDPNLEAVSPVISVDIQTLENNAFTNIAQALNQLPAFGAPAATPIGNQNGFSVGQNFVNFLGLGSQRTLTVVNGRRFVSSNVPSANAEAGGLQVDFSSIPIALVDRIETVSIRGAPIYGTDAVAGTINVILNDDYEGFEVSGQYGFSPRGGDNQQYQVQTVWGANFADGRGNVAFSMEYQNQEEVAEEDRPGVFIGDNEPSFSTFSPDDLPEDLQMDVDGDGELDSLELINFGADQVQIVSVGGTVSPGPTFLPSIGVGAINGGFFQFADNGDIVPFQPGGELPDSLFFAEGGDGFDLDLADNLIIPQERIVANAIGHFDITENIRAFGEFTFANTTSEESRNQAGFQTFAFNDDSSALILPSDHPLLTDQAQQFLADNELETFAVNRILQDFLDNGSSTAENTLWRAVAGLQGDFKVFDREVNLEGSVNFGQSNIFTSSLAIFDEGYFNALDAIELSEDDLQSLIDSGVASNFEEAEAALQALSGTPNAGVGDVICRAVFDTVAGTLPAGQGGDVLEQTEPDPAINGCVPLNPFGANNASPAALDFVTAPSTTDTDIEQRVLNINASFDIVKLPGGWVSGVIGYENRRESASVQPDGFNNVGLGRGAPVQAVEGDFRVDAVFGELLLPVVSPDMNFGENLFGFPLIHSFTIDAAARFVDNSVAGEDTTYTAGGSIAFVRDFTLRGNFTQSIRAPSLQELFTPETSTFSFAADPCDEEFVDEGPSPDIRMANCAAAGLPPDFVSNIVNASVEGTTGGNLNLTNEVANSYTVGGVIQPRWVPGLNITVDYINVTINDRIETIGLTDILEACFDNPNFPDVSECDQFSRDATGQIIDFEVGFANAALSEFQSVSIAGNYRFEVAEAAALVPYAKQFADWNLGSLAFSANVFHRIQDDVSVAGEEPDFNIGQFGDPNWEGLFDITYNRGPLQFFWRMRYQDSPVLDAEGDNFFLNLDNEVVMEDEMRIIHFMSLAYTFADRVTAQVSVNNVFGRFPDTFQQAAGFFALSDEAIGRQVVFNLRARF